MLARPGEGVAIFGDLSIVRVVYHLSRVEKRKKGVHTLRRWAALVSSRGCGQASWVSLWRQITAQERMCVWVSAMMP